LLEAGEPVRGGGDLLPGFRALGSAELLGGHRDRAAVDLDPTSSGWAAML
jgi:hypothetical protein